MKIRKILVFSLLILLCVTAVSCGETVFTVRMTEMTDLSETADWVDMEVSIGGTTYDDLLFTINDVQYRVSGMPTVSTPIFELTAEKDDGMDYAALMLNPNEDAKTAVLTMQPTDEKDDRVYITAITEFQPLLDWLSQN